MSGASAAPRAHPRPIEAQILDQMRMAVVATDLAGVITRWNGYAEELFGWSTDEAIGRQVVELLAPSGREGTAADVLQGIKEGGSWDGELPARRRDGSTVLCRVTGSPILDEHGEVVGLLSVSVDITSERESDRRLAARTAVTRILADARSLDEAAPLLLKAICENLGWVYGGLWQRDRGLLRCVQAWQAPAPETDRFVAASRRRTFESGVGLPGRVWERGEPAWIPDVTADANFPRAEVAVHARLHGAVAFPIALGGEVLGVLEFFSDRILEPNPMLVQTMGVIGSQIGQFMERKAAEEELQRSRDQLEAILQGVAEGITVQGPDGRLVYANDEAAHIIGFPTAAELVEAPVEEVMARFELRDDTGEPFDVSRLPGRLALRGEDPADTAVRFRRRGDGEDRWALIRASTIRGSDGEVRFAVNIFNDITEPKRAEDAQRFLAEAGPLLSANVTDYEQTLARVAELAVPRLADWCSIALRQEDGSIRTIKVAHVDPEKVRYAEELAERIPTDPNAPTGVPNVLRTGRSEIYPEITEEVRAATIEDPEAKRVVLELQLRSVMIVPLVAGDRVVGAISLVFAESGRRYRPEDLALAEDLGVRAGLAVHNALIYRERDHIARTLQRSLLPPELPTVPFVELAARYRPAGAGNEVGGDFYDVFETADGSWIALIGDVCGKGPEAAAVTGLARHTVRAAATREQTPSRILSALNQAILDQRNDHMFCTVACLRVRPAAQGTRVTVSCGGHPLPLVLRADGTVENAGQPGTLVGSFPDPEFHDRAIDLAPGDAIVLFTDGVTEEHGAGGAFGRELLVDVVRASAGRSSEQIAEDIENAVTGFRPEPLRDDVAILVLKARAA